MALFSKFHLCRRHFLWWYTTCILNLAEYYVRFSDCFFVTEVPRATKLRRIVQKACRYTLIAKNPFRLSVPKVRFLLATLTHHTHAHTHHTHAHIILSLFCAYKRMHAYTHVTHCHSIPYTVGLHCSFKSCLRRSCRSSANAPGLWLNSNWSDQCECAHSSNVHRQCLNWLVLQIPVLQ